FPDRLAWGLDTRTSPTPQDLSACLRLFETTSRRPVSPRAAAYARVPGNAARTVRQRRRERHPHWGGEGAASAGRGARRPGLRVHAAVPRRPRQPALARAAPVCACALAGVAGGVPRVARTRRV